MKKTTLAMIIMGLLMLLFSSCTKEAPADCWAIVDCGGNYLHQACGTEAEVQDQVNTHNATATCKWTYKK